MADDQAAFGVYPHLNLQRRPENNNPEASKDMPLQFARGMVKTGLGAIPDLAQLGADVYTNLRSPKLDELVTGKKAPQIPFTSEYWENKLPLPPTSPQGRLAGGLGEYFPENPVLGAVGHGIKGAAKIAGEGLSSAAMGEGPDWLKSIVPQPNFVVKPKGGNWLNNSVEKSLEGLKSGDRLGGTPAQMLDFIERQLKNPELPEEGKEVLRRQLPQYRKEAAINNWVDKNLTNYVKKEMATPEDPVRKLAEQDITHMPANEIDFANTFLPEKLAVKRMQAGFNPSDLGASNTAKAWERIADEMLNVGTAGQHTRPLTPTEIRQGYQSTVTDNPWLTKLDPSTPVYYPENMDSMSRDLGFDHIMDVLKEDITTGRLRPESLKNVSMEQAVRRAHEYNEDKAKKMAEAQIKATEGMPTVKEYPTGHKWIELAPPKDLPSGHSVVKDETTGSYKVVDENGQDAIQRKPNSLGHINVPFHTTPEQAKAEALENDKRLEDALKYEGDTMGHCVGGYCPDVISGQSRIFSLRDAKGEPHVTIETEPNPNPYPVSGEAFAMLPQATKAQYGQYVREWRQRNPHIEDLTDEHTTQALKEAGVPPQPDRIVQIKGKQNRAPNEQYLPFVQDFVKSGNWGEVGDLQNTGLNKVGNQYLTTEELKPKIDEAKTFLNTHPAFETHRQADSDPNLLLHPKVPYALNEMKAVLNNPEEYDKDTLPSALNGVEKLRGIYGDAPQPPVDLGTVGGTPNMKKGGKVSITNNPDAMYMEVQDRKFAGGGAVAKMVEQYGPAFMEHVKHYANVISEMMPHLSAHEVMNQATDAAALKAKGMGVPGIDFHDPLAPPSMKMSEALGNAGAEGKTLNFTEADRSRVFGDNMGGVGFSALQHYSLPHAQANTVWGFGNKTVAEKKIKQNDPENTIWTTYAGSPEQHKSNTIVVKDAIKTLQDANNKGQVHPEQIRLINKRIQEATNEKGNPLFPSDFDITDPNALNHANTFERRSAVSDALMGTGVKKPMISVEFKKANPGVQWTDASNIGGILSRETEPVLANANTFDVGPHLFVMDNGMIHRPDLNEAFPYQVTGSDLGLKFDPTPIRAASPEFIEKKGYKPEDTINAWAMSRGSPSQFVSEQYLTNLQKQGYKKGGKVTVHHLDGEEVHIIERRR